MHYEVLRSRFSCGRGCADAKVAISDVRFNLNEVHKPHLYTTGLTFVKQSVLMFYTRLFSLFARTALLCGAQDSSFVARCLAMDFVALFACIPIPSGWDPSVPGHGKAFRLDRHTRHLDLLRPVGPIADVVAFFRLLSGARLPLIGVFAAGYL